MSYAIIRNTKYNRENLTGIFRHNERRNRNYSNNNIDKEKSYLNYSIKLPQYSYEKEFEQIRKQYILSAKVHMDEQSPHIHLIFLPVVHTKDKKGNDIDKLACSEFWKAKEKLKNMKLELPDVPNLEDINVNRLSKKRDEKIIEEIIKPKDNLINELYKNNLLMHKELLRQAKMVEKAEKCQNERDKIMADNRELHNQVENIQAKYKEKELDMEL